jgi:hypothetical protein
MKWSASIYKCNSFSQTQLSDTRHDDPDPNYCANGYFNYGSNCNKPAQLFTPHNHSNNQRIHAHSTASPAPTLETIYNDTHPSFVYSANWQNVAHNKAYAGSYKLTTRTGSSVTLNFTGKSFSLLYTTGLNFGTLAIYVDNQLIATLNQKTSQIYFQRRWDSAQLSVGAHVLKLVYTDAMTARGRWMR